MERKYIDVNNIRLAYLEKNSHLQNTIFFIHGNSGSSKIWDRQISCIELDRFRLIAIDLPAHGLSSGSKIPAVDYSPKGTGKIMAAAINAIADSKPFILAGFSYGTNITAEIIPHVSKTAGILLLGSCVYGENYGLDKIFMDDGGESPLFVDEAEKEMVSSFFTRHLIHYTEDDMTNFVKDYFDVKFPFRSAMFKSVVVDGNISDEIAILCNNVIPLCIIFGAEETICHVHYLDNAGFRLWKDKIHIIPSAGHFAIIDQPDTFNKILSDYAEDMFK